MTPPTTTGEEPTSQATGSASSSGTADLARTVRRLGGIVGESLPRGELAELRRLDPASPSTAAFWKLVVGELEPLGALRGRGPRREEEERRWAVILNVLAHLEHLHRPGTGYGRALAESGFSEHRFSRLLRARGDTLWHQARRSGQFLSAKNQQADATGLAWLVLSEGRSDAQRARRHLARDYYRADPTTEGG